MDNAPQEKPKNRETSYRVPAHSDAQNHVHENPMYPQPEDQVGTRSYGHIPIIKRRVWPFLILGGFVCFWSSYAITARSLTSIAQDAAVEVGIVPDVSQGGATTGAASDGASPTKDAVQDPNQVPNLSTDKDADQDAGPNQIVSPQEVEQGSFEDQFSGDLYIEEAIAQDQSSSDQWWLNSGAFIFRRNDMAHTVEGDLPEGSSWIDSYARSAPAQTDNGRKPQNVLRLIKRGAWQDTAQEVYFKVLQYNAVQVDDRGASNGLLLFSRYIDDDNLYYGGLRVDGNAVIKKKIGGTYHTLYKGPFLEGVFDRETAPTLIPENQWVGIRTITQNVEDGRVKIELFIDMGRTYQWEKVAEVYDDGVAYGGSAHVAPSNAGIRSDFMDISFDHYKIRAL